MSGIGKKFNDGRNDVALHHGIEGVDGGNQISTSGSESLRVIHVFIGLKFKVLGGSDGSVGHIPHAKGRLHGYVRGINNKPNQCDAGNDQACPNQSIIDAASVHGQRSETRSFVVSRNDRWLFLLSQSFYPLLLFDLNRRPRRGIRWREMPANQWNIVSLIPVLRQPIHLESSLRCDD